MAPRKHAGRRSSAAKRDADYRHPEAKTPLRPAVGTQAQFKKKKPPVTYRYDSSLSPALDFDGQNSARELGESEIRKILDLDAAAIDAATTLDSAKKAAREHLAKAKAAAGKLKQLGRPLLNWAGKAERLSFDVPTLPLFIHERLSTKAIIETLKSHEKQSAQADMFDLFGDPRRSVADQVLKAYEYQDQWVNRLILGDSLVVMNSLLNYENLGGKVQMIYMDPPYGVKFGSNFQPFVRKREVSHNDDDDMTREPEMVKAYRDTWELGLHSYLTYLRDRLLLARDLLDPSGSIFVQISDGNLHHVRELMDEVFRPENFIVTIILKKMGGTTPTDPVNDYIIWFARDKERAKRRIKQLFERRRDPEDDPKFNTLISPDGTMVRAKELDDAELTQRLKAGWRWARVNYPIVSQHYNEQRSKPYKFKGKSFTCGKDAQWRFDVPAGMDRLAAANRLFDGGGNSLGGVMFWDDWPYVSLSNVWDDLKGEEDPIYVVQTAWKAVQRCMLMTTGPGELVLDPTCGSGTTAYIAEHWGRRWITIDSSRVPLALTRQRLLTSTFPYYELADNGRGPIGGFVYRRRRSTRGDEIGGIVPHITLRTIANDEPPEEEVLVHRPEEIDDIVRVTGPFTVEAMIPSPIQLESDPATDKVADDATYIEYLDRMLEVLRKSPVLQVGGGKALTLKNIRLPAKSLALSAEAMVENGAQRSVAVAFGPENGAVSEKLVFEAAREARGKNFTHLYVIGFAIQPNARELVETCEAAVGVPATYIQATPDLMMGDLLKTTRSSQIFSVCGMPEIAIKKLKPEKSGGSTRYQVELLGYDIFDPATMELDHKKGDNVPAWMLDTDYNGLVFHGSQVFFPRTSAWDNLKKALKATHEETVWDHLAGSVSAPFEAGEHEEIAVKVIDDRGNELLVTRSLKDAARG